MPGVSELASHAAHFWLMHSCPGPAHWQARSSCSSSAVLSPVHALQRPSSNCSHQALNTFRRPHDSRSSTADQSIASWIPPVKRRPRTNGLTSRTRLNRELAARSDDKPFHSSLQQYRWIDRQRTLRWNPPARSPCNHIARTTPARTGRSHGVA